MNKIFSIGEASKITGLSVQTLRNYSNMGLVSPERVDFHTGYRYYTINQIHLLDKIKYLRELDLSLSQIKDAINTSDNDSLKPLLAIQHKKLQREISRLRAADEIISWYLGTIEHQERVSSLHTPYLRYFSQRHSLSVLYSKEKGPQDSEIRLATIRHSTSGKTLNYYRQFGYELNTNELVNGNFCPVYEFMFIKELPENLDPSIIESIHTYPAGKYLCFFDTKSFDRFKGLADITKGTHSPMLAIEYSGSISEYSDNTGCEYQLYLG